MSNFLRPDEIAAESNIDYNTNINRKVKSGAKTALSLGTAALGVGLASKIAPFLNEFIPIDLAIKGINKVSPQIGRFLKQGQSMGMDIQEGLDFIKNKINPQEAQKEDTNELARQDALGKFNQQKSMRDDLREQLNKGYGDIEQRNIFEQYSPELFQFLQEQIQNGRSPLEAGALAQLNDKFKKVISKIESDHKTPFSSILTSIFGQQNSNVPARSPGSTSGKDRLLALLQQRQRK